MNAEERLLAIATRLEHYTARYESARDSRCVFTHTYTLMTRMIATELPIRDWDDAGWVVGLAEAFAARYFHALDTFDQGAEVGPAWRNTFQTINVLRTSVLEDLAAGMTAHIVHDLPLALGDAKFQSLGPVSGIRDYHTLNDVLGDAIDPILEAVTRRYNPWLRWLDLLGRRNEKVFTNYGIRLSRAVAWYNGLRLLDPGSRTATMESLERSPRAFLDTLFRPPFWPLRFLVRSVDRLISLGRRWPRSLPYPTTAPLTGRPNQTYYFTVGVGHWTGFFTFRMTSWKQFWSATLGLQNRFLVLGMAALMNLLRHARITSTIVGYPDQNQAGVATNVVRISALGVPLYLLREEYILSPDGVGVHVRSEERFGPVSFLFNRWKEHPAEISDGGRHATYYIPLLGAGWVGRYRVRADHNHIDSILTSDWAESTESIDRVHAEHGSATGGTSS